MSEPSVVEEKQALRARMLARRKQVSLADRRAYSARACARIRRDPFFVAAGCVAVYMALPRELDVTLLVQHAWQLGKRVVLPRVRSSDGQLDLHACERGDPLASSGLGVREPLASAPRVLPEELDLVVVPGLAFDPAGYRLGFGKGFYDRLLAHAPQARRLGVGFDFQLVEQVPHEPHDIALQDFISEARHLVVGR